MREYKNICEQRVRQHARQYAYKHIFKNSPYAWPARQLRGASYRLVTERGRRPPRSRCHPGHRVAPKTRTVRILLSINPLAVIPSEWPLMDNRGCELGVTWAFFFRACARIVSHALSPTARLTFLGFGLGISVAPCRLRGMGGFGVLNSEGLGCFLKACF